MKKKEAIKVLKAHNKWRSDSKGLSTDSTLLGQAIVQAIDTMEKHEELLSFIDDHTQHFTDIAAGETVLYVDKFELIEFLKTTK